MKSAAIMMGGRNSRMKGYPKYLLKDDNDRYYISVIEKSLRDFDKLYLSVADEKQFIEADSVIKREVKPVLDEVQGIGPVEGIRSVLKKLKAEGEEWVFICACDMPYLTRELPNALKAFLTDEVDCVIPESQDGEIHPLCGCYSVRMLPILDHMIEKKIYRIRNAMISARCHVVPLSEIGVDEKCLSNTNSPQEIKREKHQKKQPKILNICGIKNSGKTTYVSRLVKTLTEQGMKVAVIKHDGHDFEGDRTGTDTYKHHEAGAYGTAIFSEKRMMLNKEICLSDQEGLLMLMEAFPEADVILIEGLKMSPIPKVEILRSGISETLSCNTDHLVAVVTDQNLTFEKWPIWPLDDITPAMNWLMEA